MQISRRPHRLRCASPAPVDPEPLRGYATCLGCCAAGQAGPISPRVFKEHSHLRNDSLFSDAPCSNTLCCVIVSRLLILLACVLTCLCAAGGCACQQQGRWTAHQHGRGGEACHQGLFLVCARRQGAVLSWATICSKASSPTCLLSRLTWRVADKKRVLIAGV